ncbi:MAG TPA: hypothetical protein VNO30_50250 [Kofleriaceae bacterium]|nr:hypothetical protein [Kofleriaceae bacterium]
MSRLSDLRRAGGTLVEATAEIAGGVVQGIGDLAADCVETAGHAVHDALGAAGRWAGRIPVAGGVLRGAAAWLGGAVAGVTNVAGAAGKGGLGIAAGAVSGALKLAGGVLLVSRALVLGALIDLGAGLAGAVLLVLGTAAALVQQQLFLQTAARALTRSEREMLRRIFRRSISLYNVRLVEGRAGLFGSNPRPFTLGNTIYLKEYPADTPGLLIHECVHAWQYQHLGPRYAALALGAQVLLPDAYDWEAELSGGKPDWRQFNKEAQAELIEHAWLRGSLTAGGKKTTGGGVFFDLEDGAAGAAELVFNGADRTALALGAATSLRRRICARWSKSL